MTIKNPSTLLFLGSGGSMGIPVIGCKCDVCTSNNPRNNRMRPSVLLTVDTKKILIDCGPDFRFQALRFGVSSLDGVILTHGHNDHTAGIDDLRIYHMRSGKPLACLLSAETLVEVKHRFPYIFTPDVSYDKLKLLAKFDMHILPDERGVIEFIGLNVRYFSYEQARMKVSGFRFGDLAYVTDLKNYPESIFDDLKGIKTLIISALRYTPSPLHLSVDEAVEFIQRTSASTAWLTHLAHDLEHEKTNAYLPENIRLAYDGLQLTFDV